MCSFPAGDAPFCTPEQYKECAEPALGEYQEMSLDVMGVPSWGDFQQPVSFWMGSLATATAQKWLLIRSECWGGQDIP